MNLQAIKKICMEKNEIQILNDANGEQWIGTAANHYIVEGTTLHAGGIMKVMGLSDAQKSKVCVSERETEDEAFGTGKPPDGETHLPELGTLHFGGKLYAALLSERGLLFVPVQNLKPVDKGGYLEFYERTDRDGKPLIAVYGSMFCCALVTPCATELAERIVEANMRVLQHGLHADLAGDEPAAPERTGIEPVKQIEGQTTIETLLIEGDAPEE